MSPQELLEWLINNVLTDKQLDCLLPRESNARTIREWYGREIKKDPRVI